MRQNEGTRKIACSINGNRMSQCCLSAAIIITARYRRWFLVRDYFDWSSQTNFYWLLQGVWHFPFLCQGSRSHWDHWNTGWCCTRYEVCEDLFILSKHTPGNSYILASKQSLCHFTGHFFLEGAAWTSMCFWWRSCLVLHMVKFVPLVNAVVFSKDFIF